MLSPLPIYQFNLYATVNPWQYKHKSTHYVQHTHDSLANG
jgi:hypothetical protein